MKEGKLVRLISAISFLVAFATAACFAIVYWDKLLEAAKKLVNAIKGKTQRVVEYEDIED